MSVVRWLARVAGLTVLVILLALMLGFYPHILAATACVTVATFMVRAAYRSLPPLETPAPPMVTPDPPWVGREL